MIILQRSFSYFAIFKPLYLSILQIRYLTVRTIEKVSVSINTQVLAKW